MTSRSRKPAAGARAIPSIDRLRQSDRVRALEARYGGSEVVAALRAETALLRSQLHVAGDAERRSSDTLIAALEDGTEARLASLFRPSLRRVINATGVIVHTNLGRAPLAPRAATSVADLAGRYTNLEYDLERGTRGSRHQHAESLVCRLTGGDAAVVVNNNAAATLVALAALASSREVVISRGELVEIGGGFRIPDVMAQSGAVLREVGTTNRTRAADYAAAINERTAMILRVHPSNFRMEGFTERPSLESLVSLGQSFGVVVCEDLGSGNLATGEGSAVTAEEPTVQASLSAGVDLVWFSGDKMLGGPQAGIIVGRAPLVERIRAHSLMRALRVDKMTYAALEATLLEYLAGRAGEVPVMRMMGMNTEEIERRCRWLAAQLEGSGVETRVVEGASTIGGGSAPGALIPTRLLQVHQPGWSADRLDAAMRARDVPVIARIDHDRVVIDLRTVLPDEDALLAQALGAIAESARG